MNYPAITRENVGRLTVAWTYAVTDSIIYQFSPVIADGVMYVLAKNNSLVALDAGSGREIWAGPASPASHAAASIYWKSKRRHRPAPAGHRQRPAARARCAHWRTHHQLRQGRQGRSAREASAWRWKGAPRAGDQPRRHLRGSDPTGFITR